MRIAVLSDVHANLHALHAVLQDIDNQSPDHIYCLGDLVGYGAFPNEVIDTIRNRQIPTVMGNYDEGVGFDLADCGCIYKDPEESRRGDLSLQWSRSATSLENKAFLQNLPLQIRLDLKGRHALLVHGSPRKINEYLYEDRPLATFERVVKQAGADVILFGHTHLPYIKTIKKSLLVNTGSVGKPRDGDPRAGYTILEIDGAIRIEHRRVEYDLSAATDAVRRSELPDHFASLLERGGKLSSVPSS